MVSFALRLQVPVKRVPGRIDVPAGAVPPPPWTIEVASGWTSQTIGAAVDAWMTDRLGFHRTAVSGPEREMEDRLQVGDDLYAEAASMDVLLGLPAEDAALVTRFFSALTEALEPVR